MELASMAAELENLHDMARRNLDIVTVWEIIPGFKEKYPLHAPPRQIALCPFHSEKTPSCRVYPDSQRFHCYGCGKSGDVVDLLEELGECERADRILRLPESSWIDHLRSIRHTLEQYAGHPLSHPDTFTKPLF